MHFEVKSYKIRSRLNVTHSILPGEKAGTSCVGLVPPSEEKHGNKVETNLPGNAAVIHKTD